MWQLSPGLGLCASSTVFTARSIAGPTAPTTIDNFRKKKSLWQNYHWLPQHWVLQDASSDVVPSQVLPPQEGVGLVQDLVIKDEPGKPKLVVPPGSGFGSSSTGFTTGSIDRPKAPTTVDSFKKNMDCGKIIVDYHNTGCCKTHLQMYFQHRFCPHKKVLDLCKTWW